MLYFKLIIVTGLAAGHTVFLALLMALPSTGIVKAFGSKGYSAPHAQFWVVVVAVALLSTCCWAIPLSKSLCPPLARFLFVRMHLARQAGDCWACLVGKAAARGTC